MLSVTFPHHWGSGSAVCRSPPWPQIRPDLSLFPTLLLWSWKRERPWPTDALQNENNSPGTVGKKKIIGTIAYVGFQEYFPWKKQGQEAYWPGNDLLESLPIRQAMQFQSNESEKKPKVSTLLGTPLIKLEIGLGFMPLAEGCPSTNIRTQYCNLPR